MLPAMQDVSMKQSLRGKFHQEQVIRCKDTRQASGYQSRANQSRVYEDTRQLEATANIITVQEIAAGDCSFHCLFFFINK